MTDAERAILDAVTRDWLRAEHTVISEFSGDMFRERFALHDKVNAVRAVFDLVPLPMADYHLGVCDGCYTVQPDAPDGLCRSCRPCA